MIVHKETSLPEKWSKETGNAQNVMLKLPSFPSNQLPTDRSIAETAGEKKETESLEDAN